MKGACGQNGGFQSVRQPTVNERMEHAGNSTATGVLLGATSTMPINAMDGMSGLIKQIGNKDDSV